MSQSSQPPALIRTPPPSLTYRLISYLLVFPIYRLLFRGRTAGNGNVPRQGALVVVANHGSHLDPPTGPRPWPASGLHGQGRAVQGADTRRHHPACGAYPVSRGASDREAIRTATNRLLEGWATGVFIDGTRQSNGRVNDPQAGAALLAARAGVPLLPVAIINSHRALGPGQSGARLLPIHIRIGTPIAPPASRRRADLDVATAACQAQINALLDQGLISGRQLGPTGQAGELPPSP